MLPEFPMSLKKLGRYELNRVLGKGAMGLVYEGRDPNLDRRVAIKTIKVENLSEEAAAEYEARFRIEARSAARLQHPNIVSVYDSDRDGDIAFLVMEFITGEDLKHYLDNGDRYTLEQTLGIMQDLLAALDYAHQQGIVHRDIKPANLLIEKSGRVKLTDFGVARIQDSAEATRTQGTMVGTLKYMSPEQVQGRVIDSRADIFAAGIVLYQLLTGIRPFDGATDFAIIQQIVGHAPASPTAFNTGLPPAIDRVVARSLAKSRDERYPNAKEFAKALLAACQDAQDTTVVPPPRAAGADNGLATSAFRADTNLQSGASVGELSTVTQELELVYWKDIKESNDIEDLQLFVAKFPTGIYVDLARRRLKKLGVMPLDDSGSRAGIGLATVPGLPAGVVAASAAGAAAGNDTSTVVIPMSPIALEPTIRMKPEVAARAAVSNSSFEATLPPTGRQETTVRPASVNAAATATQTTQTAQTMPAAAPQSASVPPASATSPTSPNLPISPISPIARADLPAAQAETGRTAAIAAAALGKSFTSGEAGSPLAASRKIKPPPADSDWHASDKPALAASDSRGRRAGKTDKADKAGRSRKAGADRSSASPRLFAVWGVAGAVLVTATVFGLQNLKSSSQAAAVAAAPLPSVAPAAPAPALAASSAAGVPATVAAAAAPGSAPLAPASAVIAALPAPVALVQPAVITETAAQAGLAPAIARPTLPGASAPLGAASSRAEIRAARKAAQDKEKAELAARAAASGAAPVESAEAEAARRAVAVAPPAPPPPVAPAAPANPSQSCEGRNFLSYQLCMAEQCAKRTFTNHPVCRERKAMEDRQVEAIRR